MTELLNGRGSVKNDTEECIGPIDDETTKTAAHK